jgi:hypothetical protein
VLGQGGAGADGDFPKAFVADRTWSVCRHIDGVGATSDWRFFTYFLIFLPIFNFVVVISSNL